jgi:hypothetical protein
MRADLENINFVLSLEIKQVNKKVIDEAKNFY